MNFRRVAVAFTAAAILTSLHPTPAQAHATATLSASGVFAVCTPPTNPPANGQFACNPGRNVNLSMSGYPANTAVYVYFLNGEVDDPNAHNCSQAAGLPGWSGYTHLGTVTTNGSGAASLSPPLSVIGFGWGP